jgi:hypothetical protein
MGKEEEKHVSIWPAQPAAHVPCNSVMSPAETFEIRKHLSILLLAMA